MTPAESIKEKISLAIRQGLANPAYASDFAKECRTVNARLEQIREILDGGDELQALLMAEIPPAVLDEAATLTFPQAKEWKLICEQNGLEVAPDILMSAAQQLNLIYSKGISPNNPIYKDFREAVMERDHDRALSIAKAIEKLNPSDSNARGERMRLEKIVFQNRDVLLAKTLQSGDIIKIQETYDALHQLGLSEMEKASSAVSSAMEKLSLHALQTAWNRIYDEYLPKLINCQNTGDWVGARELVARIDGEVSTHHLELDPTATQTLSSARSFVAKEVATVQKNAAFQESLRKLLAHANEIESTTLAPTSLKIETFRDLLTKLNRLWQAVDSHGMAVNPEVIQTVTKHGEFLKNEISRKEKNHVFRWAATAGVLVIFLGVTSWWLFGMYSANELINNINTAIQQNQFGALEKLVDTEKVKNLERFSSSLVVAMENASTYIKNKKTLYADFESELKRMEKDADNLFGFKKVDEIKNNIGALSNKFHTLPQEFQSTFNSRYEKLQGIVEGRVKEMTEANKDNINKSLATFQSDFYPSLEKAPSVQILESNLKKAQEFYQSSGLSSAESSTENLAPETKARIISYKQYMDKLQANLDTATNAIKQLNSATSLESFQKARQDFIASFPNPITDDIASARAASILPCNESNLMSALLFPWDKNAWAYFIKNSNSRSLYPDKILPTEDSFYGKILNDKFSSKIYQAEIKCKNIKNNRVIFSEKSELTKSIENEGINFTGKVYDPFSVSGNIAFIPQNYTTVHTYIERESVTSIINSKQASFSIMYDDMKPIMFMNDQGKINMPIWQLLDQAQCSEKLDPTYMAFLIQNCKGIVDVRPNEWGSHFVPSFQTLNEELAKRLAGAHIKSGDWMISPETSKRLGDIFNKPKAFMKEAIFIKSLAESCRSQNFRYAGYVMEDGNVHLTSNSQKPDILWSYVGNLRNAKPGVAFTLPDNDQKYIPLQNPTPFTPLFSFEEDRKSILDNAKIKASISNLESSGVTIPPLFQNIPN
jgi:hypothetical protein